jgi:hypothetical protein
MKSLLFDIEFTSRGVIYLSQSGFSFLNTTYASSLKDLYNKAIDVGLHVRFASAEVRDKIIT